MRSKASAWWRWSENNQPQYWQVLKSCAFRWTAFYGISNTYYKPFITTIASYSTLICNTTCKHSDHFVDHQWKMTRLINGGLEPIGYKGHFGEHAHHGCSILQACDQLSPPSRILSYMAKCYTQSTLHQHPANWVNDKLSSPYSKAPNSFIKHDSPKVSVSYCHPRWLTCLHHSFWWGTLLASSIQCIKWEHTVLYGNVHMCLYRQ